MLQRANSQADVLPHYFLVNSLDFASVTLRRATIWWSTKGPTQMSDPTSAIFVKKLSEDRIISGTISKSLKCLVNGAVIKRSGRMSTWFSIDTQVAQGPVNRQTGAYYHLVKSQFGGNLRSRHIPLYLSIYRMHLRKCKVHISFLSRSTGKKKLMKLLLGSSTFSEFRSESDLIIIQFLVVKLIRNAFIYIVNGYLHKILERSSRSTSVKWFSS